MQGLELRGYLVWPFFRMSSARSARIGEGLAVSNCRELHSLNYKTFFGAAFELGRHGWFEVRRLITNSRSSAFTGSCLILYLKKTSQEDGRNKNWTMQRLLHGTLRLRYSPTGEQLQNGRTADEIPRDPITPWCGPPLFCPCFSLAETSVLKIS